MSERKTFLVRLDPAVYAALQRWAADDLRSLNAQVEFLLRRAVRDARRIPGDGETPTAHRSPPTDPDAAGGGT